MARHKLSTQPYKGVRDFYPKDMFFRTYLFDVLREVVESYGYEEYDASILEPTELYEAKSGEEIVSDQMYSFTDRGKRRVSLRPEMTPTVARLIAGRRHELSYPVRWYSIPNLFRYEKPQRGRLREHFQLNVDMFGVSSLEAEVEMIQITHALLTAFGATKDDFVIKINSRKILDALYERYKLSSESSYKLTKVLDKKEKISEAAFNDGVQYILGEHAQEFIELIHATPALLDTLKEANEGVVDIIAILDRFKTEGTGNVVFDPSITRGFDYYSGFVFEVFDTDSNNNRSMFGGGRYSHLVDIFGVEPVEAIGFGMGDVTLLDFLTTHNLAPTPSSSTDCTICRTNNQENVRDFSITVAEQLRANGLNVSIDITDRKVGDQIKAADKNGVPFVTIIGPDEVGSETIVLKHLASGEETTLPVKNAAEHIRKQRTL